MSNERGMTRPARPPALSTFGIGSLPHTQLELALQVAFQLDIPTLPQLPRADASEYMLAQALEGLPGLRVDAEGRTTIVRDQWERDAQRFGREARRGAQGRRGSVRAVCELLSRLEAIPVGSRESEGRVRQSADRRACHHRLGDEPQ